MIEILDVVLRIANFINLTIEIFDINYRYIFEIRDPFEIVYRFLKQLKNFKNVFLKIEQLLKNFNHINIFENEFFFCCRTIIATIM